MAVYKAPEEEKLKNPGKGSHYRNPSHKHTPSQRKEYFKQKEERLRKKRRKVLLVFLVIIIAIAVIIGVFALSQNIKPPVNNTPTQPATSPQIKEPTQPPYTPVQVTFPKLEDNGEDITEDGGIYIWNKKGFDSFKGTENSALAYSKAVSSFKDALGRNIKVYNMVVPNHTEFGLPSRLITEIGSNAQRDNTTVIYSNYSSDVTPVDVYNAIGQKRNDYMYYNTDPRWTTLGAYYAYRTFAEAAGFTPTELNTMKKSTLNDFFGSYATSTWNEQLLENADYIDCYTPSAKIKCTVFKADENGKMSEKGEVVPMYKEIKADDSDYYSVLLHGDNPKTILDNEDIKTGNKLLLVKDSYGNAIAPYLINNYDEVHIIDFRYYTGNIPKYCAENGIKNVLFLNGIMSANTAVHLESLQKLFG